VSNEIPILQVKNLSTHFKSENGIVKAVNDISFTLEKRETLGIVGESGSGKSVTSLTIMKLLPTFNSEIAGGEIWFDSPTYGLIDLVKASEDQMRTIRGNEISMIFQEPMTSLNPVYTCGQQVIEVILLHQKVSYEEAHKRTIDLFEKVKLPRAKDIFKSYPHQLSGGQKQRVMIAMALSCNPSILIADEPTTALDVTVQATILELMQDLRKNFSTSIIFVTHDLGVIAEITDRVLVMFHGKIMEQNKTWNIFSNPAHPYTRGLLACRPKLDLKLKVLPVVSDFMTVDEDGNIEEKAVGKYSSVGQAILMNYITEDEDIEHFQELQKKSPILSIQNLQTYFPIKHGLFRKTESYVKAVDDVSFDVYPGEILGLVGESGCGKTTLGRSILRLVEPTGGKILFEGQDITHISGSELRHLRKDMQIIFQDPYSSLNPRIPIGEAILEPMRFHGIMDNDIQRRGKVVELLETVNLSKKQFNRYPHEFSGGQRQRICIARVLALNPKFIVCDESVSALDVSVQAQVLNLLNSLKEHFNFTAIFISHDLSVVKFMSDRIVVMNKGKIEEMGYSNDIYQNPQKEYTQKLIKAIPKGSLDDIERAIERREK